VAHKSTCTQMMVMIEDIFPFQDSPKNNKDVFKKKTPQNTKP
jgi:hypothetical protein